MGTRESAQSWRELLVGLKARGLAIAPELAIGDGALGFWKALEEVFPATRHQRCWIHKAVNILNKLPKSLQANARQDLREIWLAPDRLTAEAAIATFEAKYVPKYERAVACLLKDREALLTFYDFPAEQLGPSALIESHRETCSPPCGIGRCGPKGALSQETAKLMVFKLVMVAAKTWRRLKGENQLPKVINGIRFKDGIEITTVDTKDAA